MRLIRGLYNVPSLFNGCVATIGNFDGVHLGHQAIIANLVSKAKQHGVPALVMVFEPHPRERFCQDDPPARLSSLRDKLELLASYGVDAVLCLPFNPALWTLSAEAFIQRILIDALNVRHLIVGDDFRFGQGRQGDFNALANAGELHGFGVEHTHTHELRGERISSTAVRHALKNDELSHAAALLGREAYALSGRVGYGRQLGRTLDTPTANVLIKRHALAMTGVFAVEVENLDNPNAGVLTGVANMGIKPTVAGEPEPSLEVHLFDFSGDLYQNHLRVAFKHKLRDEQTFSGLNELKAAIDADKRAARTYFSHLGCDQPHDRAHQ